MCGIFRVLAIESILNFNDRQEERTVVGLRYSQDLSQKSVVS